MLSAKHSREEIASAQRDSPEGAREKGASVLRAAASTRLWTVRGNPEVEMPPVPRLVAARKVGTKISGFTWPRFAERTSSSTPSGFALHGRLPALSCFAARAISADASTDEARVPSNPSPASHGSDGHLMRPDDEPMADTCYPVSTSRPFYRRLTFAQIERNLVDAHGGQKGRSYSSRSQHASVAPVGWAGRAQ